MLAAAGERCEGGAGPAGGGLREARPLRILQVVSTLEPDWTGGIGRVVAGFARELARRGHEVHVAGRSRHGPAGEIRGVRVHPWPGHLGRAGQLPPLLHLLRRLRPDLVHFHAARPHGAAVLGVLGLRPLLGRPAVVVSPYTGTRAERLGRAARAALRGADAVVTSSRWAAGRMVAAGAPASRLRVIHAGVDVPAPLPRSPEPLVLFLGRLAPSKGAGVLLEAFARIAADHPQWRLCLAGDGPEGRPLSERSRKIGLAERVALPGRVTGEVRETWLRRAAVAVVPSVRDNFPGALLELLARAVPCVASATGGIPELVGPAEAARLVAPGDVDALAAALRELLERPDLRDALAAAGRRRAAELAWARVAGELEALYRELVAASRRDA